MKPLRTSLFFFLFVIFAVGLNASKPVKIMPVGNSITAGEHYGYPPIAERTAFRQFLYNMLVDSGYTVDFVGTQRHGERSVTDTNWYDWNSESYPGWTIPDIARKTNEALRLFFPDILLVHVGTNGSNWDEKPGEVMQMLDSINKFSVENNQSITVFLCKIINRFISEDQAPTTEFNKTLEEMVLSRTGDNIKIIMVDMEKGAGIDYSDNLPNPALFPSYEGGDMWGTRYPGIEADLFHPNEKGNYKMAIKYFQELVNELPKPQKITNSGDGGIEIVPGNDTSLIQLPDKRTHSITNE